MAKFEGQDRREATLAKVLKEYGFSSLDEANELCLSKGINIIHSLRLMKQSRIQLKLCLK